MRNYELNYVDTLEWFSLIAKDMEFTFSELRASLWLYSYRYKKKTSVLKTLVASGNVSPAVSRNYAIFRWLRYRNSDKSRYSDIVFVESTRFRGIPISIISKFRGISTVTIELSRNSKSSEFRRNSETSEFRGHPCCVLILYSRNNPRLFRIVWKIFKCVANGYLTNKSLLPPELHTE
jgi:hypothetical protein